MPDQGRNSWRREEGKSHAFVAASGIGKYFLTFNSKTIGRSFSSPEEAMQRGSELFKSESQIIDIGSEGNEMKSEKQAEEGGQANQRPPQVQAVEDAYALGRKHGDQALAGVEAEGFDREAIGKIKAARFNIKSNELLTYITFYHVKENKSYRKLGRTWEEFCNDAGESVRSVDRILSELAPLLKSISATQAEISENALVIGDQKIEITPENKEEIEAAIDLMAEEREKERQKNETEINRLKKRAENAVEEETKTLTIERDALVKELGRLKVFDPEGKDITWSVQQMKAIKDAAQTFATLCSKFIMDDRLDGQMELLAEVEKWQNVARDSLRFLRQQWNERWNSNFGEDI
jgi:hypothetical protein